MAKIDEARVVFNTVCSTLDAMEWKYNREQNDEGYNIFTSAKGEGVLIRLGIHVATERQLMYIKSPLSFTVPVERRTDMAKALTYANWTMLNGSFEFNTDNGYVAFKAVAPYMSSMISTELCKYMILVTCSMVDKFALKLQEVNDGTLSPEQFKEVFSRKS